MAWKRSQWRNSDRWRERLESDQRVLRERLEAHQIEALDQAVDAVAKGDDLTLAFLIVFGSVAKGQTHEYSDLDLYAEMNTPDIRRVNIGGFDAMLAPNGTLRGGVNLGFEMSIDVARTALIWHDDGSFRDVLVWWDEQDD
jgi:predicted nucleotidyltransferase